MRIVFSLLFVLLIFSCKENKKEAIVSGDSIIESKLKLEKDRVLYPLDYTLDLSKVKFYKLIIKETDTSINYYYKNLKDSIYDMRLSFDKKLENLKFGEDIFVKKDSIKRFIDKSISEDHFSFYLQVSGKSHQANPILFNRKYGVLGIYHGYGFDFIYLKEKTEDKNMLKRILTSMGNYTN